MARTARVLSASGIYHLIWRGIDRRQIFLDDADCICFLKFLSLVQDEEFEVLAYCLMGNHIHLLIRTRKDSAAAMELAMKRLGIRFAAAHNHRYQRNGPVFQGRYKSVPVIGTRYFLRVLRYIHQNPVKAGLAAAMESYPWSSYLDYFGTRRTVLCTVHTEYAQRLYDLEWLKNWHMQEEFNAAAFSEHPQMLPDETARMVCSVVAGCPPEQLSALPASRQHTLLRALILQEGVRVPQLARLSGIARGVIQRHIL